MKLLRMAPILLAFALPLSAQQTGTVSGTVTAEGSGVTGAQVVLSHTETGAQYGALTETGGRYSVTDVPAGSYNVVVRMIGFSAEDEELSVRSGETTTHDVAMVPSALTLGSLEVLADRAEPRKTPVAYSDVSKAQIQAQLGSRDLPLVLNVTPSVYSTVQGGGAGDARVNVRGFSQRNTAVMINGVPVNDMENGWVYWSNWDGLGDAATSIQLQRGLSAINLATPSIGGTLNVITDPSARNPGYNLKQEFGSGNFLKTTMTASTGPVGDFALTASVARKTGDGIIDGTWTDAWSFYLASQYRMGDRNRLEFYALGAPQRHGHNLYKLNIATLNREFAASLDDYDPAALDRFANEAGRFWNPNFNGVDPSYSGRQFTSTGPGNGVFSRHSRNFINERENYFHKPQVNLNWYSNLGNGLTANTVAYYSGGKGGGTGTFGSLRWDYTYGQRFADWNATIDRNSGSNTGSFGILRNSVNNQDTWGFITRLHKEFGGDLNTELGIDWRTATIEHYREVRDLLGGDYFNGCFRGNCHSDFWTEADANRGLGDKIHYHNENDVNWVGVHLQAEKSSPAGSFYGMVGWSRNAYNFTDFFTKGPGDAPLELTSGGLTGYQIKGGAVRNMGPEWSVYGNAGVVSKVPIFDGAIDDINGLLIDNPQNETFLSFETGTRFRSLGRRFSLDANLYFTQWNDRTARRFARDFFGEGDDAVIRMLGMDARHMGVELEAAFQPSDFMRFDGALSFGDWKHTDNIQGSYSAEDRQSETLDYTFFVKDLLVGDAPQFQMAYALSLFPSGGLYLRLQGKTFGKHYANFDPFSRTTDVDAGVQSWRPPGYSVFDFHVSYRLSDEMAAPFGGNVRLFIHGYNMFDAIYIQDATDNSRFNGYRDSAERDRGSLSHKADDAEVYLGYPRNFNFGFQIYH
ncbi:MAG: TonB-dependent receptor [Gemmatimonadetes bacterium]|nr:TonB-dependent receptor [Gemmatimonadota bacterium]MYH53407.1 TonB-dependent receptor [Gemmatimonadota bacterium]MYK67457.1 TonB-dependent receptor [Gemmatimonadota bacterium]